MPAVLSRFTTLCDGVVSAMILRRNDREYTNRLVCKQFAAVIDTDMKNEVGREFRRFVGCVDATTAANALIATQRQRAIAQGAATVLGWRAALDFLWLLRHALRTGVVAGSAALYVELLAGGSVVEWYPNDIDVWVDRHWNEDNFDGIRVPRPAPETLQLVKRLEKDNCGGGNVRHRDEDGEDLGIYGLGRCPVSCIQARKMIVKVIIQLLPPNANEYARYSSKAELVCSCDVYSTCTVCVGPVSCDLEQFYRGEYLRNWMSERPHTRFDADAVSVALIMNNGVCRLDRHRQYEPGTLRLLATGMLRLKDAKLGWLDGEYTCKRIQLYKGRGFNRIVVPDRFTIRTNGSSTDYWVPLRILSKIAQIDGIELEVMYRDD